MFIVARGCLRSRAARPIIWFLAPLSPIRSWRAVPLPTTMCAPGVDNNILPDQSRRNLFGRISYDVADDWNVYVEAMYAHQSTDTRYYYGNFPNNLTVRPENPFMPASIAARITALGLTSVPFGTLKGDNGASGANAQRGYNRGVVGIDGKFAAFGSDWSLKAYYQYAPRYHDQYRDQCHAVAELPTGHRCGARPERLDRLPIHPDQPDGRLCAVQCVRHGREQPGADQLCHRRSVPQRRLQAECRQHQHRGRAVRYLGRPGLARLRRRTSHTIGHWLRRCDHHPEPRQLGHHRRLADDRQLQDFGRLY